MNGPKNLEELLKKQGWIDTETYFGKIGDWSIFKKEETEKNKKQIIIVNKNKGEIHPTSKFS